VRLTLHKVIIIAAEDRKAADLETALAKMGFVCATYGNDLKVDQVLMKPDIGLALVDMDGSATLSWVEAVWEQLREIKLKRELPVVAIFSKGILDRLGADLGIDDFVVEPCDFSELAARLRRIANKVEMNDSGEMIRCGDLVIDQSKCEVSILGNVVPLAFREYELLRFLASHKGRVFTREALLNQVWGYDYYGGDRTVDVHIRRLRSKIEDSTHMFIDTVRSIGYRFRDDIRTP